MRFFFSMFLKVLKIFLAIPLLTENIKSKPVLFIVTGASETVSNEAIKTLPLAADKPTKYYQNNQTQKYIY